MKLLMDWRPDTPPEQMIGDMRIDILDAICAMPPWQAVGHLLRCVMGW